MMQSRDQVASRILDQTRVNVHSKINVAGIDW